MADSIPAAIIRVISSPAKSSVACAILASGHSAGVRATRPPPFDGAGLQERTVRCTLNVPADYDLPPQGARRHRVRRARGRGDLIAPVRGAQPLRASARVCAVRVRRSRAAGGCPAVKASRSHRLPLSRRSKAAFPSAGAAPSPRVRAETAQTAHRTVPDRVPTLPLEIVDIIVLDFLCRDPSEGQDHCWARTIACLRLVSRAWKQVCCAFRSRSPTSRRNRRSTHCAQPGACCTRPRTLIAGCAACAWRSGPSSAVGR